MLDWSEAPVVVVVKSWLLFCLPEEWLGVVDDLTGIRRLPAAVAATAALIGKAGEKEVGDEVEALVSVKKVFALVLNGAGNLVCSLRAVVVGEAAVVESLALPISPGEALKLLAVDDRRFIGRPNVVVVVVDPKDCAEGAASV